MSEVAQGSTDQLRRAGSQLWPNLPVLLVGSVVAAAAWALVRSLPPQLGWLAVLGAGLLVLPALAGLLRAWETLLADEHFGLADLGLTLTRCFLPTVGVTALPTLAVLLTVLALELWQHSGHTWMLASVGVGVSVSAVTMYAGVIAVPYVLRTGAGLVEGWLVALYVASRNPMPVLAVLSAVALAVWGAAYLSFALVLLLPGPLTMVWAAAVAVATQHSQAQIAGRIGRRC